MFSACTMQPSYKITGTIEGLESSQVILKSLNKGKFVAIDSAKVENGTFVFKGSLTQPDLHAISLADKQEIQLFIDNSEITIHGNIKNMAELKIEGSQVASLFKSFSDEMNTINTKMRDIYNKYVQLSMTKDSDEKTQMLKQIEGEYVEMEKKSGDLVKKYVDENTSSYVAPFVALNYMAPRLSLTELEKVVESFDPKIADSKYLVKMREKVSKLKKVSIGQPFIDFTLNDPEGNPVALSSVAGKGKYVLLDFWASWCGPCRAENPVLVENYAKYKDKGFEIFAVSLDKEKKPWVDAIKKDGIAWIQVSDLKFWNTAARELYEFNSIPHNILLDKNGIIIAKDLRGEDLGAKLAELLN